MYFRQPSSHRTGAARVVLSDGLPGRDCEPRIIHTIKVSRDPEIDSETYERGIRETVSLDVGFVSPSSDSIRETLPHIPPGFFPAN